EAVGQRELADDRAAREARAKREAERARAGDLLARSAVLCERGEGALGMLTYARGLEAAVRAGDADLECVARPHLALWQDQLIRPRGAFPHPEWTWAVALHPKGCTAATGSYDGTARLWDPATGKPVGEPLAHTNHRPVWAVAYSPDGAFLLTGSGE